MATVNPGPSLTLTSNTQSELTSQGGTRLLTVFKGVNVNVVGDTVLPILVSTVYSVFQVVLANASVSLTAAAAGVFTAPNAGGTAIVANAALSALTGPTVVSQRTVAATATQTTQNLYFNVGTAQGAPATVDVYVIGYDLSP